MRKVLILQGISGSGKTHFANDFVARMHARSTVVSADDFFYARGGGTYAFDPTKLGEAHRVCFSNFLAAIQEEVAEVIVVDNTNSTAVEIAPYVLAGETFGYEVEILQVVCDPAVAAARNRHNVPEATIRAMAERIATCQMPPWWRVTRYKGS